MIVSQGSEEAWPTQKSSRHNGRVPGNVRINGLHVQSAPDHDKTCRPGVGAGCGNKLETVLFVL